MFHPWICCRILLLKIQRNTGPSPLGNLNWLQHRMSSSTKSFSLRCVAIISWTITFIDFFHLQLAREAYDQKTVLQREVFTNRINIPVGWNYVVLAWLETLLCACVFSWARTIGSLYCTSESMETKWKLQRYSVAYFVSSRMWNLTKHFHIHGSCINFFFCGVLVLHTS